MRTRSKAESQPYEWTTVPVLVKIFKVIINELSNDIEVVSASQDTEVSVGRAFAFFHNFLLYFIKIFQFYLSSTSRFPMTRTRKKMTMN